MNMIDSACCAELSLVVLRLGVFSTTANWIFYCTITDTSVINRWLSLLDSLLRPDCYTSEQYQTHLIGCNNKTSIFQISIQLQPIGEREIWNKNFQITNLKKSKQKGRVLPFQTRCPNICSLFNCEPWSCMQNRIEFCVDANAFLRVRGRWTAVHTCLLPCRYKYILHNTKVTFHQVKSGNRKFMVKFCLQILDFKKSGNLELLVFNCAHLISRPMSNCIFETVYMNDLQVTVYPIRKCENANG